jgi:hypothetical protein
VGCESRARPKRARDAIEAGTRHDHAFTLDWQAGFHQGLQSARTHHVGQRPAWERQKALARAGGEDQLAIAEFHEAVDGFSMEHIRRRLIEDPGSGQPLDILPLQLPYPACRVNQRVSDRNVRPT